jgi:benzoyl-CoA reductase subunit A
MAQEYWKWPESTWTSEKINWREGKRLTAGVDIGSTSSQAVILCDGQLYGYSSIHTGADFKAAAEKVIRQALGSGGMTLKDIGAVGSTGWGSQHASYAPLKLDEVQCHAKGARFMYGPGVHTVVDLGGQTVKAIRLYDWDRVWDFTMNDKCATGMGRNIELMSDILQIPITEMGERSLAVDKDPEPVSTTCSSFADTETVGLFRPGYKEEDYSENEVLASYLFAIEWRILGTIGKLQPLDVGDVAIHYKELGLTGGLAKNQGITKRLERDLQATALTSEYDPQLAGAIGAALLAAEEPE